MRIAALYDVHGNLPVYDVERAFAELRTTAFPGFDEVFLGSLEGSVSAAEATTEFENRRGA